MSYLSNNVYDQGLNYLDANGVRLDICSQEPTTYAQATSTYSLGNKIGYNVGVPGPGTPNGRAVTCPAITDGNVTGTGTVTSWAITNGSNELLAAGPLAASQAVTGGFTFTLAAFTIRIPAPA